MSTRRGTDLQGQEWRGEAGEPRQGDQAACLVANCSHRDGSPRLAAPPWLICEQHRDMLSETLMQVSEWVRVGEQWVHLRDFLPPGGTPDDGDKVHGRRSDPPAPLRLDVSTLLDPRSRDEVGNPVSVFGVLNSWAHQVRLERGLTDDDTPTVDTERRLLARHLDWICSQYWVRDLWESVRKLDRALREAVGDPYPKPIGFCPVDIEGAPCWTPLYVHPSGDGVRCRGCGEQWSGTDLIRLHMILEADAS